MPNFDVHEVGFDKFVIANATPVVLIGRGGGGTRLLSQMVSSFGIFMGNEISDSFDSVEWVETVYKLVIENLTAPFENGSARDFFWRNKVRATAAGILNKGEKNPVDPWGWKLPETTLIVPQIIRYFPNAKFVHLVRHPVASCCRRTHMTSRMNTRMGAASLTAAYAHIGRPIEHLNVDSRHIHNAASWAHQVDMALDALGILEDNRALLIKYEDICSNLDKLKSLLQRFLDIKAVSPEHFVTIESDRLNSQAYSHQDAAVVWDICGKAAGRVGYQWRPFG